MAEGEYTGVARVSLDLVPNIDNFWDKANPSLLKGAETSGNKISSLLSRQVIKNAASDGREWARRFKTSVEATFKGFSPSFTVHAETEHAQRDVDRLKETADDLDGQNIDVEVNLKENHVHEDLEDIRTDADELDGKNVEITVDKGGKATNAVHDLKFGMDELKATALRLSPALIPIFPALVAPIASVTGALGLAAVGMGAFGLAAKTVLGDAVNNYKSLKQAQDAYDNATTKTAKLAALKQQKDILDGMSKSQKQLTNEVAGTAKAWDDTKKSITPVTAGALIPWMNAAQKLLRYFKPLITPVAGVFKEWGQDIDKYLGKRSTQKNLEFLSETLGDKAARNVKNFGTAFVSFIKGTGNLLKDVAPNLDLSGKGIVHIADAFEKWSKKKSVADSINNFFKSAKENAPVLKDILKDLGSLFSKMGDSLGDIGSAELQGLKNVLDVLAKMPPEAIQALVTAVVLGKGGGLSVGNLGKNGKNAGGVKGGLGNLLSNPAGALAGLGILTGGATQAYRGGGKTISTGDSTQQKQGLGSILGGAAQTTGAGAALGGQVAGPWGALFGGIGGALLGTGAGLAGQINKIFKDKTVRKRLEDNVKDLGKDALNFLTFGITDPKNRKKVEDGLTKPFRDGTSLVKSVLNSATSWISRTWNSGITSIKNFASRNWKTITRGVTGFAGDIRGAFKSGVNWISDKWNSGLNAIKNFGSRTWKSITRGVRDLMSDAKSAWRSGTNWLDNKWDSFTNGVKNTASRAWHNVTNGIHDLMANAKKAFQRGAADIGQAWDNIQGYTKKPIKWVIDHVYNHGIVDLWNTVVKSLHLPKGLWLNYWQPKGFANGGFNYADGTEDHRAHIAPAGSYRVFAEQETGGEAYIPLARSKRGRSTDILNTVAGQFGYELTPQDAPMHMFADGGIWKGLKGIASKVASKVTDFGKNALSIISDPGKWAADKIKSVVTDKLKGADAGGSGAFLTAGTQLMKNIGSEVVGAIKAVASQFSVSGGTAADAKALAWAKTQDGKPYQWGGNGNPSWDCSGFMSAIESVIRGEKPHRRWATGSFSGNTAPPGWVKHLKSPFMIGVTNAGVGHTAGNLLGHNVESSGSNGVQVDGPARGYKDGLFGNNWYGFAPAIGKNGAVGSGSNAKAFALSILKQEGQGQYYDALVKLWNRESNWNPNAVNKSSGAYGIPQALGHGHPYALGDWRSQVTWGLNYIHSRYGNPGRAWAHEQSAGWYGDGGMNENGVRTLDSGNYLPPGYSMSYNGTGKYERMYNQHQVDLMGTDKAGNANGSTNNWYVQMPRDYSVGEFANQVNFQAKRRNWGGLYK